MKNFMSFLLALVLVTMTVPAMASSGSATQEGGWDLSASQLWAWFVGKLGLESPPPTKVRAEIIDALESPEESDVRAEIIDALESPEETDVRAEIIDAVESPSSPADL